VRNASPLQEAVLADSDDAQRAVRWAVLSSFAIVCHVADWLAGWRLTFLIASLTIDGRSQVSLVIHGC
jgi:hypothetical protein